jgi:hypothetical protein
MHLPSRASLRIAIEALEQARDRFSSDEPTRVAVERARDELLLHMQWISLLAHTISPDDFPGNEPRHALHADQR